MFLQYGSEKQRENVSLRLHLDFIISCLPESLGRKIFFLAKYFSDVQ